MRFRADSNRCKRFCRPLPSHSATEPFNPIAKLITLMEVTLCKTQGDPFLIMLLCLLIYPLQELPSRLQP